ncbi:MAG: SO_0444 family Cu/Zn efflux transporter [bacterium]|nr:SO_0444 family Cu/Zn efflux transporter [bacterium]
MSILTETARIFAESAPYLLLGFGLAGLLHVFLSRNKRVTGLITAPGSRSVFLAAVFGMPMPLCSCGVLPAALSLRKEGASKGATASFLISVPETDIVSIILTWVLLGPFYAIFRPIAALVTAIVTGLAIDGVEGARSRAETVRATDSVAERQSDGERQASPQVQGWFGEAVRYGFKDMFDDIMPQLTLGLFVAGGLVAVLPGLGLDRVVGGSPLVYFVMLLIGIPAYVCAAASTPVAVGLIAGGISPGAALVFLLAGPATNIASLVVLARQLGRVALGIYLACIAVISLFMGILFDRLVGNNFTPRAIMEPMAHGASWWKIASAVVLVVLVVWSFYRTRVLQKTFAKITRRLGLSR